MLFIALLISSALPAQTFSRKDTLRFAPDSSYSRAMIRCGKDLLFGTSKNGLIRLQERTGKITTVFPADTAGEFRDIVCYRNEVIGMISGNNGILTGKQLYATVPGVFYDDLVLAGRDVIVLGDPVSGCFFLEAISLTHSGTASALPRIPAFPGEACYAASGTTAQLSDRHTYCFVSGGGSVSRFHCFSLRDTAAYFATDLPMVAGEGSGPFSLCFIDRQNGICVGGNYLQPAVREGTAAYTTDGGKTWSAAETLPRGYRSCVTGNKKWQFSCGTNGIDYSSDGGKTWNTFDQGNFCALLLERKTLYATTNKGYCIRYRIQKRNDD